MTTALLSGTDFTAGERVPDNPTVQFSVVVPGRMKSSFTPPHVAPLVEHFRGKFRSVIDSYRVRQLTTLRTCSSHLERDFPKEKAAAFDSRVLATRAVPGSRRHSPAAETRWCWAAFLSVEWNASQPAFQRKSNKLITIDSFPMGRRIVMLDCLHPDRLNPSPTEHRRRWCPNCIPNGTRWTSARC
jgi:hypothetical protein